MGLWESLFGSKNKGSIVRETTTTDKDGNTIKEAIYRNGQLLQESTYSNGKNSHLPKGSGTSITGAYTRRDGSTVTWNNKPHTIQSAECGDYIIRDNETGETHRVAASYFY